MTPAEKLGYRIGDKFEVVDGCPYFSNGSIVKLTSDDGSNAPMFEFISGKILHNDALLDIATGQQMLKNNLYSICCSLNFLTKIKDEKPKAHKHAEMIKAKADNMDLVRFIKLDDNQGSEWAEQLNKQYQSCKPNRKQQKLQAV